MTTPPLPREQRTFADQGSVARLNSARPAHRGAETFAPHAVREDREVKSNPPTASEAPRQRADQV